MATSQNNDWRLYFKHKTYYLVKTILEDQGFEVTSTFVPSMTLEQVINYKG